MSKVIRYTANPNRKAINTDPNAIKAENKPMAVKIYFKNRTFLRC